MGVMASQMGQLDWFSIFLLFSLLAFSMYLASSWRGGWDNPTTKVLFVLSLPIIALMVALYLMGTSMAKFIKWVVRWGCPKDS